MTDLKQYGYTETNCSPTDGLRQDGLRQGSAQQDGLLPGRVTEHHGSQYTVVTQHGEVAAVLKGTLIYNASLRTDLPCVGDFVAVQYNKDGSLVITEVLPRRSVFSRFDAYGHGLAHIKANHEQLVASNFDYVFILTSLNWDFNVNRIQRYLTQARQSGASPVVLLTKADLAESLTAARDLNMTQGLEPETAVKRVQSIAPDVPVHAISVHTGFGMQELEQYLQPGKTVVFLGMSGVGKSSLLNALMGEDIMSVKAIREDDSRGRHTTTHRQLFMLPSGAMVIDTPGMRELGLLDADEGISEGFPDIEELFAGCRFSDCRHQTEPGCAVRAALTDGTLSPERWEQYMAQKRESQYSDNKAKYLQIKQARSKSIALYNKASKSARGHKRSKAEW